MIHAARKAGTFLGEAFMYRLHPQTAKLVELIKSGAIGEVRMIKSSFGFAMPGFMPEHRLYANDLAGGGILDVGGYPVSMARLIAGAAAGKPFADPDKVSGSAHLGQSGVDEWASARAALSGRHRRRSLLQHLAQPGQCAAHPRHQGPHRGAGLLVRRRQPRAAASARSTSSAATARARRSSVNEDAACSIPSRSTPPARRSAPAGRNSPRPAWAGPTASAICACSTNGAPRSGSNTGSRSRQAASTRSPAGRCGTGGTAIVKRSIPGLAPNGLGRGARLRGFPQLLVRRRSCSTPSSRRAAICSTPASSMARGYTEALLGEWLTNRGVREQSVLIGKGAHSPLCYPDVIGKQLDPVARPAADRLCRRLLHAPRQPRRAGRRVRRRHGRRGQGRPHPRTVRRLQLDDASAWTRRSPMPSGPASRSPARSPTISRWPKCWSRSGRAASPRPTTNGRPG